MKKALKRFLAVLIILALVLGGIVIWQWKNIESIIIGIREESEQIDKRRENNQKELVEEVNSFLDNPLRDITEEEQEKIEKGEATPSEVFQKMFEEKIEEKKVETPAEKTPATVTTEKKEEEPAPPKESKDDIVSRYMVELYKLQNEFNARAESTIKSGDAYYESIKSHEQDPVARAETISHYTPIVRGIEKECDGKFEVVVKNLESELIAAGYDTSVISTIRSTYANEKRLKLSYYANKYLK